MSVDELEVVEITMTMPFVIGEYQETVFSLRSLRWAIKSRKTLTVL